MTKEALQSDLLDFTEPERLTNRLCHTRFMSLLAYEQTHVHSIELSENTYGEFLFILTSRPTWVGEVRAYRSFWSLGYDHKREGWLVDDWFWYDNDPDDAIEIVEKAEVQRMIEKRLAEITPFVGQTKQSPKEKPSTRLTDLSDMDSAYPRSQALKDGDRLFDAQPKIDTVEGAGIALQYTLFTGELVDNRTASQKRIDLLQTQPIQQEMFCQRDIAQFGVRAHPQMSLSPDTKLVLISEDPRTPEEIERDREHAAQALTIPLFEASTLLQSNSLRPSVVTREPQASVGFRRAARQASARVRRRAA